VTDAQTGHRRHFASLTSRLVLTTVALALVVSVLIGTVTTFAVRAYLVDQLDQDVRDSLLRTSRALAVGPGSPPLDFHVDGPAQPTGSLSATWYADYEPDGTGSVVEQRTGGRVVAVDLRQDDLDEIDALPVDGEVHHVDLHAGSFRVALTAERGGKVASGLPTDQVDDLVSQLVWWEVLLALLAVAGAAGAALVVVRRQLRPLREVAATAHTVAELPLESGDIDISERVPEHLTDERTEVGQVGSALNTLLAHVETSLAARHRSEQQVRQFVADASHELRTPLATIAGYTELARRRPDISTVGTALDKVEEESDRMTALVEDLLLLARLDAGRPLEREPVDLTRLVVEAVSDAGVVAPDHRWRVDLPDDAVETPYEVTGDELRLHQVVTNLLTNARRHTPPGTTVTLTVRRDGFAVHDDGPGFPPGLAEHAFERFARGDAARTRGSDVGVGLGLALVQAIVTAHGGTVTLASTPGSTTIEVQLPG
jgi:two-component system OmpR family sensor kinase